MIRVGIIGATGYTGAELVRILCGHPEVELTVLTSRQYIHQKFDQIYPAFAGRVDLICEEYSAGSVCERADFVFIALPHQLPMKIVPELLKRSKRVIDLSADFRFKNALAYEACYQPHLAKELLDTAVYGLSEVYTSEIRNADLVGNPGCYPTSVLLPLIPLLKAGLLELNSIISDSKSGVSGAGRSLSMTGLYCEVNESFKAYKVAAHRHNPEMEEILSRQADRPVVMTFVPHLLPMTRGMESTIYAGLARKATAGDIRACIASYYAGRPFIRLCPEDRPPDTLHVKGTNYCDIGVKIDQKANRLILMSAIDNLVKGASGQAVQNMNIMLGFDETAGLGNGPFPI
ncbi:MAG: N-acetyl-gamma-glutamyl-phosphate reductase [Desulfobacterales bacterium]|nr:N-acetyl-gamma-glutamyl-phosphate reductase [Desulfobacterales bacterium]